MLEGNLAQLRVRTEALLAGGRVPCVLLDLDGTINSGYGTLIEARAVAALRRLDAAGGIVGLNTGADIVWAGERILCETDPHFPFTLMILATGRQVYAWVDALRAYALLPVRATNKGDAMRALAAYLGLSLDQFVFVADFPGAGDRQEGIDDPVLREPVGVVVNVGRQRDPRDIARACDATLLLHPERREHGLVGCECEATVAYLDCLTDALIEAQAVARQARLQDSRAALQRALERLLGVASATRREAQHDIERHTERTDQLWTFERPIREVARGRSIRIQVRSQGLVHAGVRHGGEWVRTYDAPLRERGPGVWQADLLDPEVDEFTFIWYDPTRGGRVRWEGKNFRVRRTPA